MLWEASFLSLAFDILKGELAAIWVKTQLVEQKMEVGSETVTEHQEL